MRYFLRSDAAAEPTVWRSAGTAERIHVANLAMVDLLPSCACSRTLATASRARREAGTWTSRWRLGARPLAFTPAFAGFFAPERCAERADGETFAGLFCSRADPRASTPTRGTVRFAGARLVALDFVVVVVLRFLVAMARA